MPSVEFRIVKLCLTLLLTITLCSALPQSSPYSLQAAVDALHRREAQLAIQNNVDDDPFSYGNRGGDWDEDIEDSGNRRRLNTILSNYLSRDNPHDEPPRYELPFGYAPAFNYRDELEAKKRSIFREKDDSPDHQSVFRERTQGTNDKDLSEDFLEQIDREQEAIREQKYAELLRRLWQKYKASDNDLERAIFQREHALDTNDGDGDEDFYDKKKRMFYSPMVGYPSPMMVGYYDNVAFDKKKKRDYPILPWLPAKKKRFPIVLTKRSSAPVHHEDPKSTTESPIDDKKKKSDIEVKSTIETTKYPKDEQAKKDAVVEEKKLKKTAAVKKFSADDEDKKKRNLKKKSDDTPVLLKTEEESLDKTESSHSVDKRIVLKKRSTHDDLLEGFEELWNDEPQSQSKKKRQAGEVGDECEPGDSECQRDVDPFHEVYADHSEEEEDEEDDPESYEREDESEEDDGDENDDRRKRKRAIHKRKRANLEEVRDDTTLPGDRFSKRSIDWSKTWGLDRKKKSNTHHPLNFYATYDEDRRKKFDTGKLDTMDEKLKAMEDVLLDETVKYTGAHEGIVEPKEIAKLKDHVVSRLATAYNLEKMRHALDKLKDTVEGDKHGEKSGDDKKKRVAVKKEKVVFTHEDHKPEDNAKKVEHEMPSNDMNESDDKKKKRDGDALNEISDIMSTEDSCPILDTLEKRCRGVDVLTGDVNQNLLSACAVHQLCYLCGTSQTECDYQFLTDAERICNHHSSCLGNAKSALMVLRGFSSPLLGPRECSRNSCLYQALTEIGL